MQRRRLWRRYGAAIAGAALLALTGGCSSDMESAVYSLLTSLLDAISTALSSSTTS